MFLKVGAAMMLFSLVLAAGVTAAIVFQDEAPETATLSAESKAAEKAAEQRKFDPGKELDIDDGSGKDERPGEKPKVDDEPGKEPASRGQASREPASKGRASREPASKGQASGSRPEPLPGYVVDWPQPTDEEVAVADEPRYYEPVSGTDMTLTVEALGLYDVPVISSESWEVLDSGLLHEPESSLPWDGGAQRNVFIAGHYLGYPVTGSRLVFYNLDQLGSGDSVVLKDSRGRVYEYSVSESFPASPDESWVMGQVVGRDMVTLQTCIPPNFEDRLIVRADRV